MGDLASAVVDGPGDGDGVAGVAEGGGAEVEVGVLAPQRVAQFLGAWVVAGDGGQAVVLGIEEVLALVAAHDGEFHHHFVDRTVTVSPECMGLTFTLSY